jgi:hypothetical protein
MNDLFDNLSRRAATGVSRRSALGTVILGLLGLTVGAGCREYPDDYSDNDPTGPGPSKSPCSAPKSAYCEAHKACCDPSFPHHCANNNTCYKYFTDAQKACGNSYEICANG